MNEEMYMYYTVWYTANSPLSSDGVFVYEGWGTMEEVIREFKDIRGEHYNRILKVEPSVSYT